jgi:hypothetical protein
MDDSFLGPYQNLVSQYGGNTATPLSITSNLTAPKPATTPTSSFSFGNLAKSAVNLGKGVVGGLAHAAIAPPVGFGHDVLNIADSYQTTREQNQAIDQINEAVKTYTSQYHAGKISDERFQALMLDAQKQLKTAGDILQKENLPSKSKLAGDTLGTVLAPLAGGTLVKTAEEGSALGGLESTLGAKGTLDAGLGQVAKQGAGDLVKQAIKAPVRNALLEQNTAQTIQKSGTDIAHGNIAGGVAQVGAIAAFPFATKYLGQAAGAIKNAVFGTEGVLDGVFGSRVGQFLTEHPEYQNTAKQMQQFTLNHVGGHTLSGISFLRNHLINEVGIKDPGNTDLEQEFEHAKSYFNDRAKVQSLIEKTPGAPQNIGVGHDVGKFVNKAKAAVSAFVKANPEDGTLSTQEYRQKMTDEVVAKLETPNLSLENKIRSAIGSGDDVRDIRAKLDSIVKESPQKVNLKAITGHRVNFSKGYTAINMPKNFTRLPSAEESGAVKLGAPSKLPGLANVLNRAGLSPIGTSNKATRATVLDNFTKALQGSKTADAPADIFKRLTKAAVDKQVGDARLLHNSEITNVLGHQGYTSTQMKQVRNALNQAYAKLTPEQVGAPNWIVNQVIAHAPANAMGEYLRAQGLLRYKLNPFFAARQVTKSAIIAGLHGSLPIGHVGQDTLSALESRGYFAKGISDNAISDFLGESYTGADVSASMRQINGVMKGIVGKMAQDMAASQGKTVEEALSEPGDLRDALDDAVRVAVGYPSHGYINSPLAKSLNVIVFPSRFDTKVLAEAGKAMAKMPPIAQALLVSDLAQGAHWLSSSAGKTWQQNNSELISYLNYFTPLQDVQKVIDGGTGTHLADLGLVGGLPFGVISTLLQHQGINVGAFGESTYLNPKTGEAVPTELPTDTTGRIQQGMEDLIGSLFSWPGAELGLPSKTSITKSFVGVTTANQAKNFKSVTPSVPGASAQPTLPALNSPSGSPSTVPSLRPPEAPQRTRTSLVGDSSNVTLPAPYTSPSKAKKSKTVPVGEQLVRPNVS